MKKLFFVVAAALVSTGAFAQFNKGDMFLNAQTTSLGLDVYDYDGNSATEFNLGVNGGYFFLDKLAAEVLLGFDYSKYEGADEADTSLKFGVGVRYYFYDNFFARAAFGGTTYKGLVEEDKTEVLTALDLAVGYDFFLSEKVYFEPSLYYEKGMSELNKKESTFGLRVGLGVKF
jgi:hypothetical protein